MLCGQAVGSDYRRPDSRTAEFFKAPTGVVENGIKIYGEIKMGLRSLALLFVIAAALCLPLSNRNVTPVLDLIAAILIAVDYWRWKRKERSGALIWDHHK